MSRIFLAIGLVFLSLTVRAATPENPKEIKITATKFSFSPNEITVKKGQPVKLEVQSSDANHGLVVEGLGIRGEAPKGQTLVLTFTPEKTGDFAGKCAHFCGKGHGTMLFTVHVTE